MRPQVILICMIFLGCAQGVKSKIAEPSNDEVKFNQETSWLEEIEGEKALSFVRTLNENSQLVLESEPRFNEFKVNIEKVLEAKDKIPFVQFIGNHVYNFWQDTKRVRGIWRRTTIESYKRKSPRWETVLDIDRLAKLENENWVYGGATCWPEEESRCFVSLSRGGKDAKVVREFDLKKKQFVADGFNLSEAKSEIDWIDINTAIVTTDWGPNTLTKSGYPRQIRIWKRGSKHESVEPIFTAEETDVFAQAWVIHTPDDKELFLVRSIDFYSSEIYRVGADFKDLRKLPLPLDANVIGLHKGQLLFSVRTPWKVSTAKGYTIIKEGIIVAFDFKTWVNKDQIDDIQTVFTPSETQAYDQVAQSRDAIYVSYLDNVEGKLRRIHFDNGWSGQDTPIPHYMSVSLSTYSLFRSDIMIRVEGFLDPTQLLYSADGVQSPTVIKELPARFDSTGLEVQQHWARSADGTKIPYYEVGPVNSENVARPTIMYGYGGFMIAMTPWYLGAIGKNWLERGGRYVVANIRGGSEFGPKWHRAVLKENRIKVFEDFISVGENLIERGQTRKDLLGIMGGSNGGLLVGAASVLRPDLFQAVVCQVPLLDMLNYHKWLAGDSWKGEYGDPEDANMRKVLKTYSPVHNVHAGVKYPEIFFVTSTKDDRVSPAHARKMAYRLQQVNQPFYYYENIEGGHGTAANLKQRAYQSALEIVYFSKKLNLK